MKKDYSKNVVADFIDGGATIKEVKIEESKQDFSDLVMADKDEKKGSKELVSNSSNFVVVDIETTGISPKNERVTEIVALRYNTNWDKIGVVYHNLLNPTKEIPSKIVELTGITDEMVKHKPYSSQGIKEFLGNLDLASDILVAHNAKFEYDWLTHSQEAFKFGNWICTRGIYLYMRDGNTWSNNYKRGYSRLKQVCEYYGIKYDENDAHRAEYDVLKTVVVAKKMISKLGLRLCLRISAEYVLGKGFGKRKVEFSKSNEDNIIYD